MGNRCTITFEDENQKQHPVLLYLHWNGGLESVLAFVQFTWDSFERGHGDLFTFHARFCQILCNYFPDGLSVYGHPVSEASMWDTDNGHWHFRIGKNCFELINRPDEIAAAKKHKYWTETPNIFDSISAHMDTDKLRQALHYFIDQASHTALSAQNYLKNTTKLYDRGGIRPAALKDQYIISGDGLSKLANAEKRALEALTGEKPK